ncbi:subtilisin-like protein [Macrolepiota fuliginosa MF-IS2]|uniref:tripeptidyl-peptidase II n=1 Tax=Macrolepiota fuliginosa MF-IS2 TaxID=1400762 RepID=A0A9P5XG65_9AGAR|nr:subtilisin-like protein [Macrolepiota fuliginosa MF-IS2]
MLWCSAFILLFAHIVIASPVAGRWDDFVEKHSWVEIPKGWELYSEAPSSYTFDLRIGLKQGWSLSYFRGFDRYGQHLSKEEAEEFVRPRPESAEAVEAWLKAHGIAADDVVHRTGGADWITVRVSVAQAERMLGTKYAVFYHTKSGEMAVRTMSYGLPRELHSHINLVAPTTYFSNEEPAASDSDTPSSCDSKITPDCLRTLYNTEGYAPRAAHKNTLGIAGYLEDYANHADLQAFYKQFRPDATGFNYSTVRVNGGLDDQTKPGVESNLDVQYSTGISFPTPTTFWSTGGSPPFKPDTHTPTNTNEPYLEWLNFVLGQKEIPSVISTSYGDDEQTVPRDYATEVCNLFAQLGSTGTTVFFSSGDFGVGGGDCKTNDGTNQTLFQPMFPASCPFVTAVGGTTKTNPEVVANLSGGGFSRYFSSPGYQRTAVKKYLGTLGNTYAGLFAKGGRAYPDVSAQSMNFQVVAGGKVISVAGTSASSPTVAGVFALLNDYRISEGKPKLGFVNPLLYSTAASGFNDITSGSNPGCGTSGFAARPGWDPVTGLGTPDFSKLKDLV